VVFAISLFQKTSENIWNKNKYLLFARKTKLYETSASKKVTIVFHYLQMLGTVKPWIEAEFKNSTIYTINCTRKKTC